MFQNEDEQNKGIILNYPSKYFFNIVIIKLLKLLFSSLAFTSNFCFNSLDIVISVLVLSLEIPMLSPRIILYHNITMFTK